MDGRTDGWTNGQTDLTCQRARALTSHHVSLQLAAYAEQFPGHSLVLRSPLGSKCADERGWIVDRPSEQPVRSFACLPSRLPLVGSSLGAQVPVNAGP